jgi:hypothetical protein
MKITFKNGAVVEGTKEELQDILGKSVGVEVPDCLKPISSPPLPLEQVQKDQEAARKEVNYKRATEKIKEEWGKLQTDKAHMFEVPNDCRSYYEQYTYRLEPVYVLDYSKITTAGK